MRSKTIFLSRKNAVRLTKDCSKSKVDEIIETHSLEYVLKLKSFVGRVPHLVDSGFF